jgi:predicted transposase/invertase (TIGR01784 family)
MKTDTLFYRFFNELPGCFFELVGRPATDSERYRFHSIELKDTAVRIDGVYAPRKPDEREPVYFVEYQNDRSERVYSNLLLKIGLFLEKVNPRQNWQGVVIYPSRSVEQENLYPYRGLLQSEQLIRIYLDELPEPKEGNIGQRILRLIASTQKEAMGKAKQVLSAIQESPKSAEEREKLIELIETVVAYQYPDLGPEEIEKMLKVSSFRQTKVYQVAFEEGREVERKETAEAIARRLIAEGMRMQKIAGITGLSLTAVKQLKKKRTT